MSAHVSLILFNLLQKSDKMLGRASHFISFQLTLLINSVPGEEC